MVELKRDRTPRDVVAQALEYAAYVARLNAEDMAREYEAHMEGLDADDMERIYSSRPSQEEISLAEHHREHFELDDNEAVAFNKDLRIVIVGQRVTPEIRQSVTFLGSKGIRISCLEFTFFKTDEGRRLLTQETVVSEFKKPGRSSPPILKDEFLASFDEPGRRYFRQLWEMAEKESITISWGTAGFTLNVDVGGRRVHVCQTRRAGKHVVISRAKMERNASVPTKELDELWKEAKKSGVFGPGYIVEANLITKVGLSKEQTSRVIAWFSKIAQVIRQHGIHQPD